MSQDASTWQNYVEYAAISDVGLRRLNNQDAMSVVLAGSREAWQHRGHVFMVADGMGAHAAGELASKIAADSVPHTYLKYPNGSAAEALQAAVEDANQKIHERGQSNADFRGMGTTSSVLALLPEGVIVAHVGDSRVYRLRGNRFEQLSFDHSLVWEMMASSNMKESEVPGYIPKNIITRSLGPSQTVQVDLEGPFAVEQNDVYLLCSDGLSGQVSDEEMGVILGALGPQEAARALVDLANLRGGPDNVTVVVLRIKSLPDDAAVRSASHTAGARPADPAVTFGWAAVAVLCVAAVIIALAKVLPVAALVLLGAVGALAWTLKRRSRVVRPAALPAMGLPLGRGPHRSRVCLTNNEFVDRLATMVRQLREAATEQDWRLDWDRFNALAERGLKAAEQGDYVASVQEYCRAVSFMMDELREQRRRNGQPSDGLEGAAPSSKPS